MRGAAVKLSRHIVELSSGERARLDDVHGYACHRYDVYRRRGLPPNAAFRAALAWGRNLSDTHIRDYAHDTGAVR